MDSPVQQERHEKWKNLIDEQEKSGLSQVDFCKQRNVPSAQFSYYRGILKPKRPKEIKPTGSFAAVKINPQSHENEIRLNLPNGFQCVFSAAIDVVQVKKLVEVLLSC